MDSYESSRGEKEKSPFIVSGNQMQIVPNMDSSAKKKFLKQDSNQNVAEADLEGNLFNKEFNTTEKLLSPSESGQQALIINGTSPEKSEAGESGKGAPPQFKRQKGLKKYLGLTLAVVAAIQYSLSALILKVLTIHPINVGAWRFLVMMFIPIPFLIHAALYKKQDVFKPLRKCNSTLVYIGAQAIIGSNALVFLIYALQYLNVADTIVISTSAPVFVTILAFAFLKEKCGILSIITAIVTLCGVIIIAKPPFITGAVEMDDKLMIGAILSFCCMLCLASNYVILRHLRTVNHALLNLIFSMWGFVESIVIALWIGVLAFPSSGKEAAFILVSAILSFFAQTCLTLALKYELAGPVSLLRTTEVIFAFIWQLLFLGVIPDVYSILGALIVISAVTITTLSKMVNSLPDGHRFKKLFWFLLI